MIRATAIAFVGGWLIWFWIDKNPYALGPLPVAQDDQLIANFQMAVDLLRDGRAKAAFVYVWKAHYLVLSLGAGLLISMAGAAVSRAWSRRRLSRLYGPGRRPRGTSRSAGDGSDGDAGTKSG